MKASPRAPAPPAPTTILSWISTSVGISTSWTAPFPQSLNGSTHRRPAIVEDPVILIALELAVALQQAEALGRAIEEGRRHHPRRIVQRTPQPLAGAGGDGEAVRVMDLRNQSGAVARLVSKKPIHAGERRNAEPRHGAAHEQPRLDIAPHALAIVPDEAIGAGDARLRAAHKPRSRRAGSNRSARSGETPPASAAPCRSPGRADRPVLLLFAGGAEIARAEIGEPVAMEVRIHDAKAGKAEIVGQVAGEGGAEGEEVGRIDDFARLARFHHRDVNRLLEELAGMEQPHRKGLALIERGPAGR